MDKQNEQDVIKDILNDLPEYQRMFRINSGMGWSGSRVKKSSKVLIIENPRPLHAAPKGWYDLTGWTTVEVTPDMVGQRLAVFTGTEIKTSGKRTKEQKGFANLLERMGGFYQLVDRR